MEKPKLILHSGMPKTGSSAIQSALTNTAWRTAMEASGIRAMSVSKEETWQHRGIVPKREILEREINIANMGPYFNAVLEKPNWLESDTLHRLQQKFAAKLRQMTSIIPNGYSFVISAEAVGGAALRRPSLQKLLDYLRPHFSEIQIVVYVREPLSYSLSRLQQGLKVGNSRATVLKSALRSCDHALPVSNLQTLAGKSCVTIRSFDPKLLANGDVVTDFMQHVLGIDADTYAQKTHNPPRNLSVTNEMLDCLEEFWATYKLPRAVGFGFHIGAIRWAGTKFDASMFPAEDQQVLAATADKARDRMRCHVGRDLFPSYRPLDINCEKSISSQQREQIDEENYLRLRAYLRDRIDGDEMLGNVRRPRALRGGVRTELLECLSKLHAFCHTERRRSS